jgi:hypothetical protein
MKSSDLFQKLKDPSVYGPKVKSVKILQTHISFVALTGEYAYKIKKPVNFGFLDFSTLDKRKYFCEEEVRLNRRLCPDIYIGVVPIVKKNGDLRIEKDGKIVEYAVKMKEFSQENLMNNLLQKNKIDDKTIDRIIDILVDFYNFSKRSKEIDKFGSVKSIKFNTDENFDQTKSVINITISKQNYNNIKQITNDFLKQKKELFVNRVENSYICDCHGDLHSGNIVVNKEDICIFDCIEFNKRFRYSDVASDIAFLAMDLDFLGFSYLSSYLIERYVDQSRDKCIFDILNFYKCYRAYVRGKVIGFRLNEANIDGEEKKDISDLSKKYFDLAYYYSKLCSLKLKERKPIIFATSGLTGSGKTTISRKISVDYNAKTISTDSVRKELEGIDKYERHHDAYNTGLYSPEKMALTYDKLLEKAEFYLKNRKNVVLDGTFKNNELRQKLKKLAKKNNAFLIFLYCNCPENKIKEYLEDRIKKKSISDGRWEIYLKQKDSFEQFDEKYNFVEIDISKKSFRYQIKVFKELFDKVSGV